MNLLAFSYEYSNMFGDDNGFKLKDGEGNEWNETTMIEPDTCVYDNN